MSALIDHRRDHEQMEVSARRDALADLIRQRADAEDRRLRGIIREEIEAAISRVNNAEQLMFGAALDVLISSRAERLRRPIVATPAGEV